jgi:hypothetical protein
MKKKQSNRKEHSYRLLMTKTQPISLTRATTFHILLRKGEFGSFDGGHQQITKKIKEVSISSEKNKQSNRKVHTFRLLMAKMQQEIWLIVMLVVV